MKRVLLWGLVLLAAGVLGGFLSRLLWPTGLHASSTSSRTRFAERLRGR